MAAHIEQEYVTYEQPDYYDHHTNRTKKTSTPDLKSFMLKEVEYLYKNLGDGSFGSVEEVKIFGTVCACKKLHDALIDPRNQGVGRVNSRFESECGLMSCIRHPNVVQFLGLCKHPASRYPALVMERLACSVEDLILNAEKDGSIIPFSLKISILTDTLKGLVYLHNHDPCIVHRDLTSRNILLTSSMEAKIADFGNALIIDPQTVNKTLTRTPGTAVYMPPEAMAYHSNGYNAKVDVFSFGHLTLYIMIQEFPEKLLQATYTEISTDRDKEDRLLARSEIERRQPYIELLYQAIGKEHFVVSIIRQCLSNSPERRPTAEDLLKQMLEAPECMLREESDVYHEFRSMHKLELIQLMKNHKGPMSTGSVAPAKTEATRKIQVNHTLQPSTATPASTNNGSLTDHLKSGVPGRLEISTMKSSSKFSSKKSLSKKQYTFQILGGTLRYYEEKEKGEVKLADIEDVAVRDSKNPHIFPFELTCKGKEHTSIQLAALSEEERASWIEAIRSKGVVISEEYDIVCLPNEAYQRPTVETTTEHQYSTLGTFSPPPVVAEVSKKEEILYDEIDYTQCKSTTKAAGGQNGRGDLKTSNTSPPNHHQVTSNSITQQGSHDDSGYELDYTAMENPAEVTPPFAKRADHNSASRNAGSTTASTGAIGISTSQLYLVLEEILHTISAKHGSEFLNGHNETSFSSTDGNYVNETCASNSSGVTIPPGRSLSDPDTHNNHERPPPLPPKPKNTSNPGKNDEKQHSSASSSPDRPVSLALGVNGPAKLGRANTYPKIDTNLYVNELPEISSDYNSSGEKVSSGVPSLIVEQPTDEEMVRERKLSLATKEHQSGFLDPIALKMALNQKLKTKDHSPQSPLLVTGDGNSRLLLDRPQWAVPSTDVSPIPSPQISQDTRNPLSLLQQRALNLFLPSTALSDLQVIGKGQFGRVYKATLKQSEQSPGVVVAVKEIKEYKSEQETSDFQHEMSIMKDMIHPNIIHLYGMIKEGPPRLILEYLPKGDLKNHLTQNKRSVNELVKYMIDVAMGMRYIAEKGLVHRDLAARNIMVDDNETCKVADFGLLREIPKDDTIYHATRQMPWPIRWMAPESLDEREFSSASDVWSFGVLCWEMYYPTQTPYAKFTDSVQCVMKVTKGYRLPIPSAYPSTIRDIMKACWQTNPKDRPSFILILMSLTNMVVQGHWN